MPVLLDVGTNNLTVRNDPLYLGTRRDRLDGEEYIAVVDEAIDALRARFPKVCSHLYHTSYNVIVHSICI
jgi:malate dehydrogenase (oxaloacetate-decarboxylating)(NADP+)